MLLWAVLLFSITFNFHHFPCQVNCLLIAFWKLHALFPLLLKPSLYLWFSEPYAWTYFVPWCIFPVMESEELLKSMCVFLFLVSFEKFSQVISSDTVCVPFSLLSPFWNYKYIHVNFFTASNRNPNLFFNFLSTFFSPYFSLDIFYWPSFQATNPLFSFLWLLWNLSSFNLSHCMFYFHPRVRSP